MLEPTPDPNAAPLADQLALLKGMLAPERITQFITLDDPQLTPTDQVDILFRIVQADLGFAAEDDVHALVCSRRALHQ